MTTASAQLLELGLDWYRRGQLPEARALLEAARLCAEVLGEPSVAAQAWLHRARVEALECEPKLAEDALSHAARLFDSSGQPERAIDARVRQAFVAYDAGDLGRATELAEAELNQAPSPSIVRGLALGYLGNVARSRNQLDIAREQYRAARAVLDVVGEQLYRSVFEMDLGITELLAQDYDEAWRHLESARRGAESAPEEPMLGALIPHYEALTLVGLGEPELARTALRRFEALPSEAMSFLASTHALIEELTKKPIPPAATQMLADRRRDAPAFEHARLTVRILRGLLGGSTTPDDRLTLLEAEHRVRIGSELDAQFPPDSSEWRILLALASHRHARREDALSSEELIAAGWPGERIGPDAAKNRLHVALSKLRKRGLRDLLLRYPSGYALSPGLTVLLAQSERA